MQDHSTNRASRVTPFRQADVTRAIKGAQAAGFEPGELRISQDGTIRVLRAGAVSVGTNRIDQLIEARSGKA